VSLLKQVNYAHVWFAVTVLSVDAIFRILMFCEVTLFRRGDVCYAFNHRKCPAECNRERIVKI